MPLVATAPRPSVAEARVSSKNPFFRFVPVREKVDDDKAVADVLLLAVSAGFAVWASANASASSSS